MTATDHPFYEEEREYLGSTIHAIEHEIEQNTKSARGEHLWAPQDSVWAHQVACLKRIKEYKEMLNQPYFGRVDWQPESSEHEEMPAETYYVGLKSLPERNVFAWADDRGNRTLPGELYYTYESAHSNGTLLLKRALQIAGREILAISDDYVADQLEGQIIQSQFTDSVLSQILKGSRPGRLREIVATIQKQQFLTIRLPKEQVLLIQGTPGSGKTVIALHRVAYLLYNNPDLAPQSILVLGPNPLFINYASGVLPILGERQVPQMTFDQWIVDRLDVAPQHESLESALESLLDPVKPFADKAMLFRNARNKGSIKMASLLERYAELLQDEVFVGKEPLIYKYAPSRSISNRSEVLRFERTVEEIRGQLTTSRERPLNQRREALENGLVLDISREIVLKLRLDADEHKAEIDRINEEIQKQVHNYFSDWRAASVSVAYRALLRKPEILLALGSDLFDPGDLELMTQDAPTAQRPFKFSDLGALVYLKLLLDGTESAAYSHVVIDEAQDLPPIFLKVLARYCRSKSMTLLGDLGQSIYLQSGVTDWSEFEAALPGTAIHREIFQVNYRSTRQITEFANTLLEKVGQHESLLAQPLERDGQLPVFRRCTDSTMIATTIPEIVGSEQANGWKSIAIITQTAASAARLAEALRHQNFTDFQLIDSRSTLYDGGTAVIASYLTKGLEFDCVIIADADDSTYETSELNARLLYVAVTRAAHALYVLWSGQLTPLLDKESKTVDVQPHSVKWVKPHPVLIEDYALQHQLSPDWCVERLAGMDKLRLLNQGQLDATVLEVLLRHTSGGPQKSVEESDLGQLNSDEEKYLTEQLDNLYVSSEPEIQKALALSQITCGLMRNQMRALGLISSDEQELTLFEQVSLLARLLKTVNQADLTLPAGRWTTVSRVMDLVDKARQADADTILKTFIDYGVVEEMQTSAQRSQIRPSQQFAKGLLGVSLGNLPDDWDADLLAALATLPRPVFADVVKGAAK